MRSIDMKDDEILRQYLLGRLSDEQAGAIEERLLKDGDLFELAEAMEGDLFAAAARGELSPADQARVRWYLARSPKGHARYEISRELVAISREQIPAEVRISQLASRTWVRAAVAAAGVAFVAVGLWLGTYAPRDPEDWAHRISPPVPSQPAQTPAPQEDQIAENTPAPVTPVPEERPAVQPAAPPEPVVWTYLLALSQVRGPEAGIPVAKVPAGTQEVEIQLPLNPDEPITLVAATLRNVSTEEVLQRVRRTAPKYVNGQRMVVLTVPANELIPGTYEIEVLRLAPEEDLLGRPTFEVASN